MSEPKQLRTYPSQIQQQPTNQEKRERFGTKRAPVYLHVITDLCYVMTIDKANTNKPRSYNDSAIVKRSGVAPRWYYGYLSMHLLPSGLFMFCYPATSFACYCFLFRRCGHDNRLSLRRRCSWLEGKILLRGWGRGGEGGWQEGTPISKRTRMFELSH